MADKDETEKKNDRKTSKIIANNQYVNMTALEAASVPGFSPFIALCKFSKQLCINWWLAAFVGPRLSWKKQRQCQHNALFSEGQRTGGPLGI